MHWTWRAASTQVLDSLGESPPELAHTNHTNRNQSGKNKNQRGDVVPFHIFPNISRFYRAAAASGRRNQKNIPAAPNCAAIPNATSAITE